MSDVGGKGDPTWTLETIGHTLPSTSQSLYAAPTQDLQTLTRKAHKLWVKAADVLDNFYAKRLKGVWRYRDRLRPVRSLDTKSAPRIYLKPFDLESSHVTQTSIQTYCTAVPATTSLSTPGRKLKGKTVENTASDRLG